VDFLAQAVVDALRLIVTLDSDVLVASWASLRFAGVATVLASLVGIPAGVALALARFPGRRLLVMLTNTLLAVPTVVVGLFVYALICRQGPLGPAGLLFTPWAVILGQAVLILPLVVALVRAAVAAVDPVYADTARTLGAGPIRTMAVVLREARGGIAVASVTSFGRAIGEVGVAMMLGGNIAGYTRTITTVIALETSKGEFALAVALGLVLLVIALAVNGAVQLVRGAEA